MTGRRAFLAGALALPLAPSAVASTSPRGRLVCAMCREPFACGGGAHRCKPRHFCAPVRYTQAQSRATGGSTAIMCIRADIPCCGPPSNYRCLACPETFGDDGTAAFNHAIAKHPEHVRRLGQ